MLKVCYGIIGVLVIAGAISGQAHAQRGDDRAGARPGERSSWELFGCVDVGRRPDQDIIEVGRREGRFSAIRLRALGNDIAIEDLKVVYGNGRPDDIRVRSVLREDDETKPLDLQGRERALDRVEVITKREFRGEGRGKAVLCVYGLEVDRPEGGVRQSNVRGSWEELGCAGVGIAPDFDKIPVGRREGRFMAIRLGARGDDVHVESLRVIYGNGKPDEIHVRTLLRKGEETRPLDLEGRGRSIDRIELVTKRDPRAVVTGLLKGVAKGKGRIGRAQICVYGLEDDRRGMEPRDRERRR